MCQLFVFATPRTQLKTEWCKMFIFWLQEKKKAAPWDNRRVSVWANGECVDASLSWTLGPWQCCEPEGRGCHANAHCHFLRSIFYTRTNSKNSCPPSALPMELVHRYTHGDKVSERQGRLQLCWWIACSCSVFFLLFLFLNIVIRCIHHAGLLFINFKLLGITELIASFGN